jgi:predicted metal-dependent phosphoesterase TrpH
MLQQNATFKKRAEPLLKFDFHIHSSHSSDSILAPSKIVDLSRRKRLDGIAVADHHTILGGLKTRDQNRTNLIVIVGCEIKTEWGDVLCLFLEKEITSRRFLRVVEEVRMQNGILILAHPFWKHNLSQELLSNVDLIETFNSRISRERNRKGEKLAEETGLPQVAVSDAHLPWEIGRGITCFERLAPPADLRQMILKDKRSLVKVQGHLINMVISQGIKKLRKRRVQVTERIITRQL